ncbi:filamentous hemagglutinin [Aphanothece hegewaldii CCALA 016]|uniref:Filamentous hemagglutinin n=1 Tax=Aphanothece hegewaldii CCALA 016 TaxID=2107694 RepID=A0A2T1M2I0_9CHRO|nr:filamentous hemagglutinin N-terminal domain-containing protein [Aphanothece hegewaldii]PSF38968.1 filamentous hemagglutinin [Aphanothece hegewaldii CCALA 016]
MKPDFYRWLKIISLSSCLFNRAVLGQIIPDGTLPTQVEVNQQKIVITGGQQAGKNLFHSFNEFSVPIDHSVSFDNSLTIDNIISRVTGGKVSLINGLIQANGTANLYIINPMGFIFGPNATIDLGGSFIASSASSIKFADGREFGVNHPETSLLTVAVPIGLQFGQTTPGAIINRSQSLPVSSNDTPSGLKVKSEKTIALIGGTITLENGNLTALAGRIEVGSVAENSYVSLTPISKGLELGYESVQNFLDIFMLQESIIDASDNGGSVKIQGRNITLKEGTQIGLIPLNDQPTGNLIINGSESVVLIGEKNQTQRASSTGLYVFGVDIDGGNVIINTQRFSISDGAIINIETFGQGKGGNLTINASQITEIMGTGFLESTVLFTGALDKGDGGNITINTGSLIIKDGGQITANTLGEGKGGTISINVAQTLEIIGQGITTSDGRVSPSLIAASSGDRTVGSTGNGQGGSIDLKTDQLIIKDGGQITVESFLSGAAGTLTVNANSIVLDQQAKITAIAENNDGNGGEIRINAKDSLELRNNSSITAEVNFQGSSGNGGNISIETPFIFAVPREDSDIVADAGQGNGGNINITALGLFGIQVQQGQRIPLSEINASSRTGLSGIVSINRLSADSQSNLVILPTTVINTDNLIVSGCRTRIETAGEFSIKGRGGLPVDPNQTISHNQGLADLGSPSTPETRHFNVSPPIDSSKSTLEPIIEAQGWMRNEQGQIILTARATAVTPQAYNNPTKCSGP